MLLIDGSNGEGGGQILRTSLSLSLLTGQPFRAVNIRAGRAKAGLLRQHLSAVLAAAEIGQAEVEGAQLGSQTLAFKPKAVRPGDYRFVIGTAGSGTLVFQTIFPVLATASGPSHLIIEGGTHNNAAPPLDYLTRCFLPLVERMGPKATLNLIRYGFYPAGGGCFQAEIQPCAKLSPIEIGIRGPVLRKRAVAIVANLPGKIAKRETDTVKAMFSGDIETQIIDTKESPGPGNVVMLEISTDAGSEMFTAFGELGVTAENVARHAVRDAREYLISNAVAGEHLTDQLLLPLALAGGGSFTSLKLTRHAMTNIDVIRMFLPVRFETTQRDGHIQVEVHSS